MNTVSRLLLTGLASVGALLALVVPTAAHGAGHGGMGSYGGGSTAMGGTAGGFGLGSLLMIVTIVIVAALAIGYHRSDSAPAVTGNSASQQADAIETLRERYARGELSEDEFERRRQTLSR